MQVFSFGGLDVVLTVKVIGARFGTTLSRFDFASSESSIGSGDP